MTELPMYGGQHDPSVEANPKFSTDAAKRGWKAYYEGDFDTAIKRFNQAWMFNRNNPEVYWGFGLVMGQRSSEEEPEKNLKESIRLLEIGRKLDGENGRMLGDLALSHTLLGSFLKSKKLDAGANFHKASELFKEAYRLDPGYPPTVANWAVYFLYTRDYLPAQEKANQAMEMGYDFTRDFLKDLELLKRYHARRHGKK